MTDRWLNRDAVEWVLYESDVGGEQFPVLVVVASFAGPDGRGAYPARSAIGTLTRRSVRKVERGLAELVKDGHLLRGDNRLVLRIRADRRPNVSDLPDTYRLWLAGRGVRKSPRGASTGRQHDTPPGSHGASGTTERGVRNDRTGRHRDAQRDPEKDLKNARDAQPSAASPTPRQPTPAVCRECGNRTDAPYHRNVCASGAVPS